MMDSVYIFAPETLQGRVCGLCGNYNDNPNDELQSASGAHLPDYAEFINAWLDPLETRDIEPVSSTNDHPCSFVPPETVSI